MALDFEYPRLVLAGLVVVTVLALGVAAGTSTASFGIYNAAWDGASDLQGLAEDQGATAEIVTNTTAYDTADPDTTVAVILSPGTQYDQPAIDRIERFVSQGGTLVVAEDFSPHSNSLLAALGASTRIDGALLRDERNHYRAPAMPLATNVSGDAETAGVDQLTLNHGTALEPGNATVLVRSSEFAYLDRDRDETLDTEEELSSYPVVTQESIGEGRILVVGDSSLFINVMLDRPGNHRFVSQLFERETVVLDYSHAGAIPPLRFAVLALRKSILLQLSVGFGGLVVLGVLGTRPGLINAIRPFAPGGETRGMEGHGHRLDTEDLTELVQERHPDFETDRVERVVRAIITRRHERRDDD